MVSSKAPESLMDCDRTCAMSLGNSSSPLKSTKSRPLLRQRLTVDDDLFSCLTGKAETEESLNRVNDMSANIITFRNSTTIEGYMRERAKRRNAVMKRQMSQFLLRTKD